MNIHTHFQQTALGESAFNQCLPRGITKQAGVRETERPKRSSREAIATSWPCRSALTAWASLRSISRTILRLRK